MGFYPQIREFATMLTRLKVSRALEQKKIVITETTESGSVPQLKVTNHGADFVLLIDGEELAGAKQNRVLNTSILVKGNSEITIPVSCTEHGRWSYVSREFCDSELVMAPLIRAAKIQSVTSSLKFDRGFRSDQGEVWERISHLQADARVASPTGAMKDVYTSKKLDLDEYVQAMPSLPNQRGLMVCMNGKTVGLDRILMGNQKIFHPRQGAGTVLDSRHKGFELLAGFSNGRQQWVRFDELNAVSDQQVTVDAVPDRPPRKQNNFKSRRMVEAFRLGIVPFDAVDGFLYGRGREDSEIKKWLETPSLPTLLVIGEYGSGKTRLLQHTAARALATGYAVAHVELDIDEAPFSRPKKIF